MSSGPDLAQKAERFALDLAEVASAFVGRPVDFVAKNLGNKFLVQPTAPIPLRVGQRVLLTVDASYFCMVDREEKYLVVEASSIRVFGGPRAKGDPLFRYEYERSPATDLPSAHLHVHAHRDDLVMAMALAGEAGATRRITKPEHDFTQGARMWKLHFPLGGHRFRPSLEDVLQMLRSEFGVSVGPAWEGTLRRGRETYRRAQTATAVRECPSEAVTTLERLGYIVTTPASGASPDDAGRLQSF